MPDLPLELLNDEYAIHRFDPNTDIPKKVFSCDFYHISKTHDELSIVCPKSLDLESDHRDGGWACIKVKGPLDFGLTGILADLSDILAKAHISIFALSTYDTDYILVKSDKKALAIKSLTAQGHFFVPST